MQSVQEKLIKSPLNYVGGKFKLLPQILPLFPDNIHTFVDLFGGGFNVGINVRADKIIYNDILDQVVDLLITFKNKSNGEIFDSISKIINEYSLSDSNKEAYFKLRDNYNELVPIPFGTNDDSNKCNLMFYTLICHSFSNQIRFNSKNEFNLPFGERSFNDKLQNNLKIFLNKLHELNVVIRSRDFRELKPHKLNQDDFVYLDPPYLITCATYNEKSGWTEKDEKDLLNLLDNLHNHNIKFALSNVLETKGKSNDILKEWSKKYKIHRLEAKYGNANYQRKEKDDSTTQEVLITNY
jgi:DNA adenine methylase